jgi:mRNA interferase RelE/StbE
MQISDLSLDELKELVKGLVDDRIRDLLGDPDLGLQLTDALRTRLKNSLASEARVSGEEIADQLGLRW